MSTEDMLVVTVLAGGPMVLGSLTLVAAVKILQRRGPDGKRTSGSTLGGVVATILGVGLLLGGLGVGACFGMMSNLNFH